MLETDAAPEVVLDAITRTVVRAPGRQRVRVRDVLGYGPLLRALAIRDLKARYKQSALGPAWTVFQPLALLGCFIIGFRGVAHVRTGGVDYPLFALSGLALWTYIQAVLLSSSGAMINNWALVRWTACPRLALPLASLISQLPSLAVPTVAALGLAAALGYAWVGWLLLPLVLVWMLVVTGALGILLAVLAVRARDVLSALPFLMQVALFISPVAYDTGTLSPAIRTIVAFNPLTGLIETWRWSLLGTHPQTLSVWIALGVSVLLAIGSWRLFQSANGRIADEI